MLRRKRTWLAFAVVLLALALVFAWARRERIADNVIAGQLKALGLPGTYKIAKIGPDEQVIRDLVIGDPRRPDLTIAQVRVATRIGFGLPGIGRITLVRPRLYGSVRGGKVSFGSLDKALFTGGGGPFRLPDYDLAIQDGRALIESDYGRAGIKLDGKGRLRGGFSGEVAAIMPGVAAAGCTAQRASVYGKLTVTAEKPRFVGPVRLAGLDCPAQALRLASAGLQSDVTFDPALDGGEGRFGLTAGPLAHAGERLAALKGDTTLTYRKRVLTARYDLTASGLAARQARVGELRASGRLRSSQGLARWEVEGDVAGRGLATGSTLEAALATAERSGQGTLIAPLLAQVRTGLARESRGSALDGSFLARRNELGISLVVPRASLRGGSGEAIAAVSRLQVLASARGLPRIGGNFATGGAGLPRIAGRMERAPDGSLVLRVRMPEYRAGDARVAVPELAVVQARGGTIGFSGQVLLSGALPGGRADNLLLPLDGTWSDTALAVWRQCTQVRFGGLALANLSIDRKQLTICPVRGRPLLESRGGAVSLAGGVAALDLSGHLGETPIRLSGGPIGFAYPGVIAARAIDVRLGQIASASQFRIAKLDARVGQDIAGSFDGSDVSLYAVPLDLHEARGKWRYAGGVLTLTEGAFRLVDRQQVARFQPVVARDATLTLKNNVIDAKALMREPASDREVVVATIRHDLGTARGHAELAVNGSRFDDKLQPETLSRLALGVVANTKGTVRGQGRIDWSEKGVTSTGAFSSDALDFAAAFGPVKEASGTIRFTDLLGLVTAPGQQIKVASINPGIEVNDGVLTFAMQPGMILAVDGGTWPFFGGTLRLLPTRMQIGVAEVRHYTLEVTGLDAAQFVQRLDLANMNATGTFDGSMPLVFDENGGRIEGGFLKSRSPGGNVSYVGELTYKDLSAMANFAFDALKSMNYREMTIAMSGALEGEIVTRVSFSGVSQGEGASKNFLTRRIASLPIQFNVNVRAPFLQLVTSFKSLYDPTYVRDPRTLGLLDADGKPVRPGAGAQTIRRPDPSIQPPASETMP